MKKVVILHNTKAGDRDLVKSCLINMVSVNNYHTSYYNLRESKKWTKEINLADAIISAGGDGTIRAIVKKIMRKKEIFKLPSLAIFPLGTANNISKALRRCGHNNYKNEINNWRIKSVESLDVGIVHLKNRTNFFLESSGFGLLPLLMYQIDSSHILDRKSKLIFALKTLYELTLKAPANDYIIKTENGIYIGKAILVEVANSPYIGPNLEISPSAKLNDGLLDIVVIEDTQRKEFIYYLKNLINGKKSIFNSKIFKAEKVEISTNEKFFHVDDEIIKVNQKKIIFELRKNALNFFS